MVSWLCKICCYSLIKHHNVNIGKPKKKPIPKILCGIGVGLMPDGMIRFCHNISLCRDSKQQGKRQMNFS
jgi:hypothetical protein